jgi:MerR family redox-sensitive transcriptional activator SoxR
MGDQLTIGELATRVGVATSALRFYESEGLIESRRTEGNQRRYPRATLRRVSVIKAAQALGLTLREIQETFEALPDGRTPTKRDWQRLSRRWRERLDQQIAGLEALRKDLDGCIGCGCLSLKVCSLFNPGDALAGRGPGPRILMGEPSLLPLEESGAGPKGR